jgi:hypothetical protein
MGIIQTKKYFVPSDTFFQLAKHFYESKMIFFFKRQ